MTPEGMIAWLMDSDPALLWQVERDILGEAPQVWEATHAKVANEGWGLRLLELQDPDGQWAGGAFFLRTMTLTALSMWRAASPWTATTWTLNLLREWGLDPAVLRERRTVELLAENSRWEHSQIGDSGAEGATSGASCSKPSPTASDRRNGDERVATVSVVWLRN